MPGQCIIAGVLEWVVNLRDHLLTLRETTLLAPICDVAARLLRRAQMSFRHSERHNKMAAVPASIQPNSDIVNSVHLAF